MRAAPPAHRERQWSLSARLYVIAGVAVVLAWIGGGAAMLVAASDANERMRHENLANLAQTVLSFAAHELDEIRADAGGSTPDVVHRETATTLPKRYSYQIWSARGELLLRSVHAPADRRLAPAGFSGFDRVSIDGSTLEVFALRSLAGDLTIVVADSEDEHRFAAAFGGHFLLVMAVLLPAVLGGAWWMLRHALVPLVRASRELGQRGPQGLAPLSLAGMPAELRPIIESVNRLMSKVDDALSQEKGFTALAAHELRTPLASLRVQAQVLARSSDPLEQRRELAALEANVDRCTRMLNQMLALARVDALQPEKMQCEWLSVGDLVAEVLADFVVVAEQRGIEVECDLAEDRVFADGTLLQMLLRNLLGNAIRHTPDRGRVRVRSGLCAGRPQLLVEDSGPGIPAAERQRVFERFYRGHGERGTGVGLGLAIVQAIARAHRARVSLRTSELGGLGVEVQLPSQPRPEFDTAAAGGSAGPSLASTG